MNNNRRKIVESIVKRKTIKPIFTFRKIDENTFFCHFDKRNWSKAEFENHCQEVKPNKPLLFSII